MKLKVEFNDETKKYVIVDTISKEIDQGFEFKNALELQKIIKDFDVEKEMREWLYSNPDLNKNQLEDDIIEFQHELNLIGDGIRRLRGWNY